MPKLERGYVQVYMGDGKGKTTSALGMALRMSGHGGKTIIVQFMKGWPYSEATALANLPGVELVQTGTADFVYPDRVGAVDYEEAERGLSAAREAVLSGRYDLVILDELNVALSFGLLELGDVLDLIDNRPPHVELVLTGRNPPQEIIDRADLVTEMVEVRHHYRKGVLARKGIDC